MNKLQIAIFETKFCPGIEPEFKIEQKKREALPLSTDRYAFVELEPFVM